MYSTFLLIFMANLRMKEAMICNETNENNFVYCILGYIGFIYKVQLYIGQRLRSWIRALNLRRYDTKILKLKRVKFKRKKIAVDIFIRDLPNTLCNRAFSIEARKVDSLN